MKTAVIVAMDPLGGIGYQGKLPWEVADVKIEGDLKRFKALTTDNVVVMGRNTFASLPWHPYGMPNRVNVVLSRDIAQNSQKYWHTENPISIPMTLHSHVYKEGDNIPTFMYSWDANSTNILATIPDISKKTIFFIGGARVINDQINSVDEIHLTITKEIFRCDTFIRLPFDVIDTLVGHISESNRWEIKEKQELSNNTYYHLVRKQK